MRYKGSRHARPFPDDMVEQRALELQHGTQPQNLIDIARGEFPVIRDLSVFGTSNQQPDTEHTVACSLSYYSATATAPPISVKAIQQYCLVPQGTVSFEATQTSPLRMRHEAGPPWRCLTR
ncbi:hypothetical protein V2G26_013137 [Clonostachys chloroleuca]